MSSHGDAEKTIITTPDEQRWHLDYLALLAHRVRIDHAPVIVDRTGQIA